MRRAAAILLVMAACEGSGGGDTGAQTDTDVTTGTTTTAGSDPTLASTTSADSSSSSDPSATLDSSDSSSSSSSTGEPPGTGGCGMPAVEPSGEWVARTLDVGGTMREYWVWLPNPYDPERAYPVVYQFHGCYDGEDRWTNNPPVQDVSGPDAIHIRGKAVGSCWDTAVPGPDLDFFDALVPAVEATWCADPARRFATGYSGGAFMTHVLGCVRGDQLRGVASIAGGYGGSNCSGRVAALLIHDANDSVVDISSSMSARDAYVASNACDAMAATTPVDPAPCEAYASCDEGLPVVWCQTAGQDHSRQDGLAAAAFWGFLSPLAPLP